MKLIIEIPDRIHFGIEKGFCVNGSDASQIVLDAIKNGTPIPDNATNGDVIKAMFPNGIKIDRSTAYAKRVTEDWWKAPYQKGGKE